MLTQGFLRLFRGSKKSTSSWFSPFFSDWSVCLSYLSLVLCIKTLTFAAWAVHFNSRDFKWHSLEKSCIESINLKTILSLTLQNFSFGGKREVLSIWHKIDVSPENTGYKLFTIHGFGSTAIFIENTQIVWNLLQNCCDSL